MLLTALGAVIASDLQKPLISQQRPVIADNGFAKSLVDTDKLQDSIKIDNLLDRAKDLFEIARLSEPEFGHPTRVIGSKGRRTPFFLLFK